MRPAAQTVDGTPLYQKFSKSPMSAMLGTLGDEGCVSQRRWSAATLGTLLGKRLTLAQAPERRLSPPLGTLGTLGTQAARAHLSGLEGRPEQAGAGGVSAAVGGPRGLLCEHGRVGLL